MLKLEVKFDCQQGAVRAVRFNKDGNYCVTCGADKTVKLWNPYKQLSFAYIQVFNFFNRIYSNQILGHSQEVLDADCSHDHSFLCTCSLDKSIFYFDVKTAKIVRKFRGHHGRVNCVRFNPEESNLIISGSIDGSVKIWDLRSKSFDHIQEIDDCKDSVTHLDISQHEILISCLDKRLRLYDIRQGKMYCDYVGDPITCGTLSKDGQCLLASTLNNRLVLLDKTNGEFLNKFEGHQNKTYQLESCFNNSSSEVLTGSEDGFVYVFDLVDAKIKQKLTHATKKTVHSLNYHPDSEQSKLLTAQEQYIYLWS